MRCGRWIWVLGTGGMISGSALPICFLRSGLPHDGEPYCITIPWLMDYTQDVIAVHPLTNPTFTSSLLRPSSLGLQFRAHLLELNGKHITPRSVLVSQWLMGSSKRLATLVEIRGVRVRRRSLWLIVVTAGSQELHRFTSRPQAV